MSLYIHKYSFNNLIYSSACGNSVNCKELQQLARQLTNYQIATQLHHTKSLDLRLQSKQKQLNKEFSGFSVVIICNVLYVYACIYWQAFVSSFLCTEDHHLAVQTFQLYDECTFSDFCTVISLWIIIQKLLLTLDTLNSFTF